MPHSAAAAARALWATCNLPAATSLTAFMYNYTWDIMLISMPVTHIIKVLQSVIFRDEMRCQGSHGAITRWEDAMLL